MNYMWRVTKYDPKNRDSNGSYSINEWTSFSDIGKIYNGIELSTYEYIQYEKAYIKAVFLFMKCNQVEQLKIVGLEIYDEETESNLEEGMILSEDIIESVIRDVLRERIWCKLIFSEILFIHFGYDYNMYIGSMKLCREVLDEIEQSNLFIEGYQSPYFIS